MSNRGPALGGLVTGAVVRPVIPTDFDQAIRIAEIAVKAGLFQGEGEGRALAQATMAVLQGLELGVPPMQAVQQIAIIGGRCTVWGDMIPALIWRAGHKIREWIEGEGEARVAWCEITRSDNQEVIKRKFSVDDAKRAGLWDDRDTLRARDSRHEEDNASPWYRYQERMLQMRARGFCARDGVPDVLHGLYIRDEIEEERPIHKSPDTTPGVNASELMPPPAPDEAFDAPDAAALASVTHVEPVRGSGEFLSDLDVNLAACRTGDQLEEVWVEGLETICGFGMQHRQTAELIYERHKLRVTGQTNIPVVAAKRHSRTAA